MTLHTNNTLSRTYMRGTDYAANTPFSAFYMKGFCDGLTRKLPVFEGLYAGPWYADSTFWRLFMEGIFEADVPRMYRFAGLIEECF